MQPKELKRKTGWTAPKNFRNTEEAKAAKAAAVKAGVATNTYMAVNPVTKKLEPLLLKATRRLTGAEQFEIKKEYYSSNYSMSEIALKYGLTRNQVASACHVTGDLEEIAPDKVKWKSSTKTPGRTWDTYLFESWEDRKKRRAKEKAAALAKQQGQSNANRPQT